MVNCGQKCVEFFMEIPTARSGGNVAFNNIFLGFTDPNGAVSSNNPAFLPGNNVSTGTAAAHFVDAASGNYQLRPGSTAINAGRNVSQYGVSLDYEGQPRPVGAYDVGAYEFRP